MCLKTVFTNTPITCGLAWLKVGITSLSLLSLSHCVCVCVFSHLVLLCFALSVPSRSVSTVESEWADLSLCMWVCVQISISAVGSCFFPMEFCVSSLIWPLMKKCSQVPSWNLNSRGLKTRSTTPTLPLETPWKLPTDYSKNISIIESNNLQVICFYQCRRRKKERRKRKIAWSLLLNK